MSGRTNFTWEQRIEAVDMYLSGNYSYTEVARKFGTVVTTLKLESKKEHKNSLFS
ncbi:transposase [Ligilactobacillus agilis]